MYIGLQFGILDTILYDEGQFMSYGKKREKLITYLIY